MYSYFATISDDNTIKKLLSDHPMDSWVSITLEREPSYFKGISLMGKTYTLMFKEDDKVVGICACSYLPVHINTKIEKIGYLGLLRVSKPFRNKIRYIKYGFDAIDKMIPKEATVPYFFTSIASENFRARRLLESNLKGMPKYYPRGKMSTLIFSHRRGKILDLLKQATKDDIEQIATFYNQKASKYQFSPHLTKEWLENLDGSIGLKIDDFYLAKDDKGAIRGCLALWDQQQFKQSVIQKYKTPLKQIRKFYNLYARLSKRVELPKPKERLQYLFIAFFAFEDEKIAINMLTEAAKLSKKIKGVKNSILGVSSKHPLMQKIIQEFRPAIYQTQIQTVVLANEKSNQPTMDDCIVQPEVALL